MGIDDFRLPIMYLGVRAVYESEHAHRGSRVALRFLYPGKLAVNFGASGFVSGRQFLAVGGPHGA